MGIFGSILGSVATNAIGNLISKATTNSSGNKNKSKTTNTPATTNTPSMADIEKQLKENSQTWWNEYDSNPGIDPNDESTWTEKMKKAHEQNNALGGYGEIFNYSDNSSTRDKNPISSGKVTTTSSQNPGVTYTIDIDKLMKDIFGQAPTYTAPTQDEMQSQAKTWAETQISPLLAAIQNSVVDAQSAYDTGLSQVNAAYANVPEMINQYLAEAERLAQNDAISRNMSRSGVLDWSREERQKPILAQAAQTEAEKAAKVAELANALVAAKNKASNLTTEAEARQGTLEATRLSDLEDLARQLAAQQYMARWGQVVDIANVLQNSENAKLDLSKWLALQNLNG